MFRSPVGRQLIESIVEQVAVAGVRSSDLSNLRVPYPALHEQHAAAEVLGALDGKIALNERIATAIAELADAIFLRSTRSAELVRMSDLMTPVLGGTPDRKVEAFWGAGIPWASAKDVGNSIAGVVMDTEEQITDEATRASRAKPMPPRSVLLTARGTVGIVARITQPTAINQSCYAFMPEKVPAAVLFHLVHVGSRHMLNISHGTVFSTVNMNTFDHVKVPRIAVDSIPDLEGELAPLHRLIESRLAEIRTFAAL